MRWRTAPVSDPCKLWILDGVGTAGTPACPTSEVVIRPTTFIFKLDASLVVTRPLWAWAGQVSLVVLGTHLAADRIEDAIARGLTQLPIPWPDPATPMEGGRWISIALELAIVVWAARTLWRASAPRIGHAREWAARWSLHNLYAPLAWTLCSLAGCWSLSMAIEDALPIHDASVWVARSFAVLIAIRICGTAVADLVLHAPEPKRRTDGLLWLAPLALVSAYATIYGLPIWGWR